MYVAVDPKSGKPKEYANSAEFFKDVEALNSKPKEQPEVKTFEDASKRLREELGIDLRTPAERQQAEMDTMIEQRVAAGVAAAMGQRETQQASKSNQSAPSNVVSHSAPPTINDRLQELSRLTGWLPPKTCGCKAGAHAPETVHVSHGRGPVMQSLRLKP